MASATGNEYAILAGVKAYLPSNFATVGEYADALLEQDIRRASRFIDTQLRRGGYSVPFADIADDPSTPEDISTMCTQYASQLAKIRANRTEGLNIDESGNSGLMRLVIAQLKDLNTNVTQLADAGTFPKKAYITEIGSA